MTTLTPILAAAAMLPLLIPSSLRAGEKSGPDFEVPLAPPPADDG